MFNKLFISKKEYDKQIDRLHKEIYDLYEELNKIDKRIDYLEVYADFKTIQYNGDTANYFMPDACKNCSNHPNNGGSGICHCILGLPKVTV